MNDKNLIPNSERSPKELREMGRKGGIKSGESRRRNKRQREAMKIVAQIFMESEDGRNLLQKMAETFDIEAIQSENHEE